MNIRQICGAAVMAGLAGTAVGVGVAAIATPTFVSRSYRELPAYYPIYGAVAGAIAGAGQCVLLQLKKQSDEEEQQDRS